MVETFVTLRGGVVVVVVATIARTVVAVVIVVFLLSSLSFFHLKNKQTKKRNKTPICCKPSKEPSCFSYFQLTEGEIGYNRKHEVTAALTYAVEINCHNRHESLLGFTHTASTLKNTYKTL